MAKATRQDVRMGYQIFLLHQKFIEQLDAAIEEKGAKVDYQTFDAFTDIKTAKGIVAFYGWVESDQGPIATEVSLDEYPVDPEQAKELSLSIIDQLVKHYWVQKSEYKVPEVTKMFTDHVQKFIEG